MSIINHLLPDDPSSRDEFALRAAITIQVATLVFVISYLFLYLFVTRDWQLLAVAGVSAAYGLFTMLISPLITRGRTTLAVWLMLGGMCLSFQAAALLIDGLGAVLGLSLIAIVAFFGSQTLPRRQVWVAIAVAVVFGVGAVLLSAMPLENRLHMPQLQVILIGLTIAVLSIFGVFVYRRFSDYSLRTKLIVGFLVVSLISVAVVSVATAITTYPQYEREAVDDLSGVARAQSAALADLLARQVEALNQLASSSPVVIEAKFADQAFADDKGVVPDREQILAQILEQDGVWRTASDTDPLLQSRLLGGRVFELTQFENFFPDHQELFFTDVYGAVVVATQRTPQLYYGDHDWWQTAYNNGAGGVYIGKPQFNPDTGTFGITMAVPIRALESDEVVGVLHSHYRLEPLLDVLSISLGEQSALDLYVGDGEVLESGALQALPENPANLLVTLDNDPVQSAEVTSQTRNTPVYKGVPSLVAQSLVESQRYPFVDRLQWRVVAHQSAEAAQSAVVQQANVSLRLGLIIALIAALGGAIVSQWLTGPIVRLTNVVKNVTTSGDLTQRVPIESQDEIGTLAESFNTMAGQLQKSFTTLEDQVMARTRQIELVVDLGRQLSAILDLNELMRNVVTVTKETFNYYHVHIYLLDAAKETLIMAEGYGKAGEEMKRQQHSISYTAPKSLVARAAREGRVVTVENVRQDPSWLPNPLLPETHSEMAVPVMLGAEVVGVLDIQSERVGGLTPQDEAIMLGLAQQIAVAVRNARLFTETENALKQAQRLQSVYTGEAWSKFSANRLAHYEVRQFKEAPSLENITTPEAVAALQQQQTIGLRLGNGHAPLADTGFDAPDSGGANAVATPLKLRDQIIGVLGVRDEANPNRRWSDDELALIEAVSEQMSLAIENARLFEETGRRAGRERMIAEVTRQVWASAEIEEVMRTAVAQLGDKLQASEVVLRLAGDEDFLTE